MSNRGERPLAGCHLAARGELAALASAAVSSLGRRLRPSTSVPIARNTSRFRSAVMRAPRSRRRSGPDVPVVVAGVAACGACRSRRTRRGARDEDPCEDEPADRRRSDTGDDQPTCSGEIGPDVERVVEAEDERRETRVVEHPPAALADTPANVVGTGEREHEPAGDDAARDGHGPPTGAAPGRAAQRSRSAGPGRARARHRAARPSRALST